MRLAPGYNERLAAHDRDLRVRWSPTREVWLLERRARYQRVGVDPSLYGDREHDTVRQLRDGYFTLGTYQPGELPSVTALIAYLRREDVWRGGTQDFDKLVQQLADAMDADDEQRREARRKAAIGRAAEIAGEVWEYHQWKDGHRVAVPMGFPSKGRARRVLQPRP